MEWKKEWMGKRIFVKLKSGDVYSGKVYDIDDSDKLMVFFTIRDKYNQLVTFLHSEIIKIKEESDGKRER